MAMGEDRLARNFSIFVSRKCILVPLRTVLWGEWVGLGDVVFLRLFAL